MNPIIAPGNNHLVVLAEDIRAAHADIQRSAEAMAERALAAGAWLTEAKDALPHGAWEPWLAEHVGMSARTARRYMQLTRSGMKTATVADLGIRGAAKAIARRDRIIGRAVDAAIFFCRLAGTEPTPDDVVEFLTGPDPAEHAEHAKQLIAACERRIAELATAGAAP